MKSTLSSKLSVALIACVVTVLSTSAMAETKWEKHHPRRDQVNDRLQKQNQRIHHEVKEGDMTQQQARQLHKDDRQVRQEERDMAHQNGGAITKSERNTLNQQENGISKQIGQ